jgi:hypothetical protein
MLKLWDLARGTESGVQVNADISVVSSAILHLSAQRPVVGDDIFGMVWEDIFTPVARVTNGFRNIFPRADIYGGDGTLGHS